MRARIRVTSSRISSTASSRSKTPRPIVEKLHAEVKAFLPELTERFLSDGMLMMDNSSVAALQDFVRSEIARWELVVRKAGLTGTQ